MAQIYKFNLYRPTARKILHSQILRHSQTAGPGASAPLTSPLMRHCLILNVIIFSLQNIKNNDKDHYIRYITVSAVPNLPAPRFAARGDLVVPRTRLQLGNRAFCVAGPVAWNSLPLGIRSAPTLSTFKNTLKTSILSFLLHWLFPEYEQWTLYCALIVTLAMLLRLINCRIIIIIIIIRYWALFGLFYFYLFFNVHIYCVAWPRTFIYDVSLVPAVNCEWTLLIW